jgi:hypothetical protein
VRSGLVWLANLAVQFAQALKNFGSWLADLTSGDPVRMRNAVQAAATAFDQLSDWVATAVSKLIQDAIAGLLQMIQGLLSPLAFTLSGEIQTSTDAGSEAEVLARAERLADSLYTLLVVIALIPVAVRAITLIAKAFSLGISWLVEQATSRLVVDFIVKTLVAVALSLAITKVLTAILVEIGWIEEAVLETVSTVGLAASLVAAAARFAFRLFERIFVKATTDVPFLQRYRAFSMSLFSLVMMVLAATGAASNPRVRFNLDMISLLLASLGFVIYVEESDNPIARGDDIVNHLASTIEKFVVYGTVPVTISWMVLRAETCQYEPAPQGCK